MGPRGKDPQPQIVQGPKKVGKIILFTTKYQMESGTYLTDIARLTVNLDNCDIEVFKTKDPRWYVL